MKKQLIISMIIMAGSMGAKAEMALSLTNSTGQTIRSQTSDLTLNTGTLVDSGGLSAGASLSGTSTVNDEFTLDVSSGYAFDRGDPKWDTTAHATANKLRYTSDGLAPFGDSKNTFSKGEILFFTVSGLDAGNSLNLSSYTITGKLPKNMDFIYQRSGDAVIQRVDTQAGATTTAIDVTLSNGDTFGFASWLGNLKENGSVGEITFDVIPEPVTLGRSTLGLITF